MRLTAGKLVGGRIRWGSGRKPYRKGKVPFTLIEIVVALAILSLGVVSYLSLANSAQRRLFKAKEKWMHFHMLAQGVEYLMLQTSDSPEPPPLDYFDYPGYHIECYYQDVEELEEDFLNLSDDQAPLRAWVVELIRDRDGKVVDSVTIDRIDYENDSSS